MDERNNRSPREASSRAIWTVKNVWNESFSSIKRDLLESKLTDTIKYIFNTKVQNVPNVNKEVNTEILHTETSDININRLIANEVTRNKEEDALNDEDEEVRKNVWSDVDDELYIANLIKLRTSNEDKRVKRDISAHISVSDIGAKVVNSVKLDYEMWELEPTDLTECDCLGPPPEFLLPPPPRPPFLQAEYYCGDDPIPDLETCDTEPVSRLYVHCIFKIFSHYHTTPVIP
ncbi:hypothetical protein RR46_00796 [Papilio xuthus]|uniref:Uncharacterized protein n=1 Tax=Papilio xuthus TaxID=66420 RepID=A0A0N1I9I5_PAPXU|nr:hypothetical protein RR46_00796 [Papilio xuthus]